MSSSGFYLILCYDFASSLFGVCLSNYFILYLRVLVKSVVLSQLLAHSQKTRDSYTSEQADLMERMEEYQKKVDQDSKRSFSASQNPSNGDAIQSFPRSSHKAIEAVMQSTVEGKVLVFSLFWVDVT